MTYRKIIFYGLIIGLITFIALTIFAEIRDELIFMKNVNVNQISYFETQIGDF